MEVNQILEWPVPFMERVRHMHVDESLAVLPVKVGDAVELGGNLRVGRLECSGRFQCQRLVHWLIRSFDTVWECFRSFHTSTGAIENMTVV